MKILIAEDEPSLRENLQWMLEMEGYEVLTAVDGRDALAQAAVTLPDLIITDVMMPHLDGFGLVKALRENAAMASVPIIMLSAKADRNDVRTGMNLGADDYLTKPYQREELLETLRTRLARSALLRQASLQLKAQSIASTQLDSLTCLPNRELFEQHLGHLSAQCSDSSEMLAVLCFGMDGFAKINQSLGKAVGDRVLCEVADRLTWQLKDAQAPHQPQRLPGRLGGDLFAVCLTGALDAQTLEQEAGKFLDLLAKPYQIEGHNLFLTACAGASLSPPQTGTFSALLLNAESALYHAKPAGPGSYQLFDSAKTQQVMRKLEIHNELHRAVEQGELQVFYQPQVDIKSGALVGFEALLRWQHRTMGWISPAEFIPVAEENGIIVKIGEWVMRTAAAQAAQWTAQGYSGFRMAVNLSVRQFAGNKLPGLVQQVLQDTPLAAHLLELEVTESLALQSVDATLGALHQCKALGVKLAMDDFGTGYSSLAYLKRFPIDKLKIDQSFVREMLDDPANMAIVRATVALGHTLGLGIVAEGVELAQQADQLQQLGCDELQGFYFSRPLTANALLQWLDTGQKLSEQREPVETSE